MRFYMHIYIYMLPILGNLGIYIEISCTLFLEIIKRIWTYTRAPRAGFFDSFDKSWGANLYCVRTDLHFARICKGTGVGMGGYTRSWFFRLLSLQHSSSYRSLGRFLGYNRSNSSVFKSNRLHTLIFWFPFMSLRYVPYIYSF